MRAFPALVAAVAAVVALSASAGCYSVPQLIADGGSDDGPTHMGSSSSGGGSGSSSGTGSGSGGSSGSSSGGPSDASTHGDAAPCTGAVLCACMNAQDCAKGLLCAQPPPNSFVGQAIFTASGSNGFCTKGCCTSSDCPMGSVCWASGEGGQYCVDPTWVGRSKPASAPTLKGGSTCNAGSQCNSGLCVNGACADTCCSYNDSANVECVGTASCVFGNFPGVAQGGLDSHFAPHCAPRPGSTQISNPCNVNSDCQGGLCYPFGGSLGNECTEPCRNTADCGASNSYCDWDVLGGSGTDVYAACFPLVMGSGYGASCTSNSACASNVCDGTNCSAPCFDDADCSGGPASWHCSPGIQLTFQTAGTYSVLSCGP